MLEQTVSSGSCWRTPPPPHPLGGHRFTPQWSPLHPLSGHRGLLARKPSRNYGLNHIPSKRYVEAQPHQHPLWATVRVPSVPLLIQLPVNSLGKATNMAHMLGSLQSHGRQRWNSGLLALTWLRPLWPLESHGGKISLLSLSPCNSDFQLNK